MLNKLITDNKIYFAFLKKKPTEKVLTGGYDLVTDSAYLQALNATVGEPLDLPGQLETEQL